MCGIFGYIGHIPNKTALQCIHTLEHRGPDDWGIWHNLDITLGHRRLSILDLSDKGRQPMSYADGRYWIIYNGEIYNFIELRHILEGKGYRFKSETDTEVILAAFIEWGERCLDRFNGMWAFAIWDEKEKSLFLSRDRFGKKPLFYTALNDGFAFASEMKALLPLLPTVQPNVALIRDLRKIFFYENTDQCLIKGIKRFPAGHFGWYKDSSLSMVRWWCTLDHLVDVPIRYEDQVEKLRELFIDACKIRMRSDVPLGTALSGGLDSSSTISVMAHIARSDPESRINQDWQHAFVASFPNTHLDESQYAQMVIDHLDIKGTILQIDPLKYIENIYQYLFLFEENYITDPIPFLATYGAMRKQGVFVTIDGHGADELFGGYGFNYIFALRDAGLNLEKINNVLTAYYNRKPKNSPVISHLPPKPIFWLKWHIRDVLRKITLFPEKVFSSNKSYGNDVKHPNWNQLDNLNKTLYISTHKTVLPTLLRNYDRYSMANGVEIRMPFMDHRIVSFAFSIPWSSKIRNHYSKTIIRDAVFSFLPPEIAYRKTKIGFNSPTVYWMQGPLKPFFLDLIHSTAFQTCELINPRKVENKIKQIIENPKATYHMGVEAWTLISPFLWEQAVIKRNV